MGSRTSSSYFLNTKEKLADTSASGWNKPNVARALKQLCWIDTSFMVSRATCRITLPMEEFEMLSTMSVTPSLHEAPNGGDCHVHFSPCQFRNL